MEHDLLKPTEVAKLLRVSVRSVYRWILNGEIGYLKRDSRYLIPRDAVRAKLRQPVQVPVMGLREEYPTLKRLGIL